MLITYRKDINKISTGQLLDNFRVTLGSGIGVVRRKRAKRYEPVKNPYVNGQNASHGLLISSRDSNDYFTKQDAVKQAKVLGVNQRTMEDWLEKMIKQASIVRVMKGKYQKIIHQIA